MSTDQQLLSPLGSRGDRPIYPLAPRIAGIEGRRIGLLDNSKHNASIFLDEIERLLRAAGAETVRRRKPSAAASAGAYLDELAESCDAIVNAYGDCGSCTSWCVHDSVDIERRNRPVATINTSEFASLGRFEAGALGIAGLPIVQIPHPVGSLPGEVVRGYAKVAFGDVIEAITGDPGKLAAEQATTPAVCSIDPADAMSCGCDLPGPAR